MVEKSLVEHLGIGIFLFIILRQRPIIINSYTVLTVAPYLISMRYFKHRKFLKDRRKIPTWSSKFPVKHTMLLQVMLPLKLLPFYYRSISCLGSNFELYLTNKPSNIESSTLNFTDISSILRLFFHLLLLVLHWSSRILHSAAIFFFKSWWQQSKPEPLIVYRSIRSRLWPFNSFCVFCSNAYAAFQMCLLL